jgi:hypothetical protein
LSNDVVGTKVSRLTDELSTANRGCVVEIGGGTSSWDQYEFLWQMILSRGVVPLFP